MKDIKKKCYEVTVTFLVEIGGISSIDDLKGEVENQISSISYTLGNKPKIIIV